jgi:hypothetical protein|tara:strand:- start:1136 stop:1537 length:402 start_codon:yes stop_codon:yes gene_type:complete
MVPILFQVADVEPASSTGSTLTLQRTSLSGSNTETNSCKVSISSPKTMLKALFSLVFAAVMWVQVPQWQPDWSQCSVDTPDVDCHWYVTAPDNTFGEGFSWENAPWFSAEGLRDVGDLNNTMTTIHGQALAAS